MKSIELLSELLAGKKIVRGDIGYQYGGKLKDNYFVYDDNSKTELETFLRLTLNDWRVENPKSYNDLKLGEKFYFNSDKQQKIYIKAMIYSGNIEPIYVGLSDKGQSYSYVSNNPEVTKV